MERYKPTEAVWEIYGSIHSLSISACVVRLDWQTMTPFRFSMDFCETIFSSLATVHTENTSRQSVSRQNDHSSNHYHDIIPRSTYYARRIEVISMPSS